MEWAGIRANVAYTIRTVGDFPSAGVKPATGANSQAQLYFRDPQTPIPSSWENA